MRRPTQADVARLAEVSTATVSYVASGRANRSGAASPEVTARVRAAMAELGYRPQWAGRALRRQRTGILAVITYAPLNPWAEQLLDQVHTVASAHQLNVGLLRYRGGESVHPLIELLRKGWADAAVVLGFGVLSAADQEELADLPLPVLALANEGPDGVSYVRQHEPQAMATAIAHLRDLGRDSLLFVNDGAGEHSVALPNDRRVWFTNAVAAEWPDVPVLRRAINGTRPTPSSVAAVTEDLRALERPAVLCGSDRAALALLWGCVTAGLRIPQDVAVIGMGNVDEGRVTAPPLTTLGVVDPDYTAAVEHVIARIADRDLPAENFDRPWGLIRRGTA